MHLTRDITGLNFIVTGAARGIGLAISTLFYSLGARVSGWDLAVSAMKETQIFSDIQEVDVTNENATQNSFAKSLHRLGDIDGIIANAGINGPTKPMWEYSLSEWNAVMYLSLIHI